MLKANDRKPLSMMPISTYLHKIAVEEDLVRVLHIRVGAAATSMASDFLHIYRFVTQARHLALGPASSALEHGLLYSISSPIACWHVLEPAGNSDPCKIPHRIGSSQTTQESSGAMEFSNT